MQLIRSVVPCSRCVCSSTALCAAVIWRHRPYGPAARIRDAWDARQSPFASTIQPFTAASRSPHPACGAGLCGRLADDRRGAAFRLSQFDADQRAIGLQHGVRRVEKTARGVGASCRRSSILQNARAAMCTITMIMRRISIAASWTRTCNTRAPISPMRRSRLEEAQEAKKRHIAAKLDLRPGTACSTSAAGLAAWRCSSPATMAVHVTGITLSTEQLKTGQERAARQGLTRLVDFRFEDYRQTRGPFDRIVSVGMFEHVGGHITAVLLAPRTASRRRRRCGCPHHRPADAADADQRLDSRKHLSGRLPANSLPAVARLEKQDYWLADFENLRLHYALTLAEWSRRSGAISERFARSIPSPRRALLPHMGVLSAGLRTRLPPQRPHGIPAAADEEDRRAADHARLHVHEERRLMAGEAGVPARPRMAGE